MIKIQNGALCIEASSTAELSEILLLTQPYDFFTRQEHKLKTLQDTPTKALLLGFVEAFEEAFPPSLSRAEASLVFRWIKTYAESLDG